MSRKSLARQNIRVQTKMASALVDGAMSDLRELSAQLAAREALTLLAEARTALSKASALGEELYSNS